jgi:UDP-glucose 4-epimerase
MALVLITGSCGLVGSESSVFFAKKGFEIIGIDNNSRKSFFGKDGDISWVKNKLKRNIKNYKHNDLDITNFTSLEKILKNIKKE